MDQAPSEAEPRTGNVLSDAQVGPRVVKGGAQRAAGFVVSNLLTAVGAVVVLRYLGVEEFGRFGTVMALLALVQGLTDAGLGITASRELAVVSDESERREMLGHILGLRIVLTAVGVVCAVLFAVVAGYDDVLVTGTLVAGVGVLFTSLQAAMLLPLIVGLENGRIAVSEILRQALLVALFVALVIAGSELMGFFVAQLVAGALLLALTPAIMGRRRLVMPRWSTERVRPLVVVGLPIAVFTLVGTLYFRLLVVLMSVVSDDATEIGYFVTSSRVIEIAAGLPVLLVTVVLPVMSVAARDDRTRLAYVTARMTETMAIGGVLVALLICIAARPLVLVVGGSEYEDAATVLSIQGVSLITIFLTAAWSPTLISTGNVRELVVVAIVGVAAVVGLGLALIPPMQAEGAAITAVAADLVLCGATFVAVWRAGPGREVEGSALLKIALAALPAAALGFVPGAPDVVLALGAAALFVALAKLLGVIPGELQDAVRAIAARAGLSGRSAA